MSDRTRGYAHRVDIFAEMAEVWHCLIDPERIERWYAPQVRVNAREGGSYWVRLDDTLALEAHIDVFLPPRRLRLIYMPLPGQRADDAVIVDDFLLERDETTSRERGRTVTVLRLLGSGIPERQEWDATYVRLRAGWDRSLLRLKVLLEPSRQQQPTPAAPAATVPKRPSTPPVPKSPWARRRK
jgi:uncharacterized protein YndB with AHSA1/START domain